MTKQSLLHTLIVLIVPSSILAETKFQPYVDHGGTIVGISGQDFCMIGSDTRLSEKYMIQSRNIPRIDEVEKGILLAAPGCMADLLEVVKILQHEAQTYRWSCESRLRGLDKNGKYPKYILIFITAPNVGRGSLYKYDVLGSFEKVVASCAGRGEHLLQPILDRLVKDRFDTKRLQTPKTSSAATLETSETLTEASNSMEKDAEYYEDLCKLWHVAESGDVFVSPSSTHVKITENDAKDILINCFKSAAQREISVGDSLSIWTVSKNGLHRENIQIK